MAKSLAPIPWQFFDNNGDPLSGGKVFTYVAGSAAKLASYTDSTGSTANSNPVILDSAGRHSGIWLDQSTNYKIVVTASTDTDPPTSPIDSFDVVLGVIDNSTAQSEWVATGHITTYINATQFSVPGDQTATYEVNRRIKVVVSAGTKYGKITAASFASSITTITVSLDSGNLDSGLSSASVSLITVTNPSVDVAAVKNATSLQDVKHYAFESGTKIVAYQASAPTGWTQDTNLNDYMLTIVSSGGGTTAGTNGASLGVPATTTGSHTLTTNEIPAHTHTAAKWVGHNNIWQGGSFAGYDSAAYALAGTSSSGSTGGGQGHTHTLTSWVPLVAKMILITKD